MSLPLNRREFLQTSAACAAATMVLAGDQPAKLPSPGSLILNDDGYVFLLTSDDLTKADLKRYLQSYCRPGVDTVAYCVGDMSWPTLYPSKVGVHYKLVSAGDDIRRIRIHKNVDNLESESGGYFGSVISLVRELGKKVLASFRMNDAHFTSLDNPNVSEFWKQQAKRTLGPVYGYYGGCLNYEFEEVRQHIHDRIVEFAAMFPDIDGIELDCMRSPYFFPPDKGKHGAPLFTELVRKLKSALSDQAKRLNRPEYLLTVNVPLTPELAMTSGLDVAAWDSEKLVHAISAGTYNAYMNHPLEQWKKLLTHGTPVLAYVGCSPHDGQYLGLEEYRAAAANAYGAGADGVYLFNYPCLFELAMQRSSDIAEVPMNLIDLRTNGQRDFGRAAQALDEIGKPASLKGKNKHYLFYPTRVQKYRHHDPDQASLDRSAEKGNLTARFRCFEELAAAKSIKLKFKLENTVRSERFSLRLNGQPIAEKQTTLRYASNGRDTRMHTVTLEPYLEYEVVLNPSQLKSGENALEATPTKLRPDLKPKIHLLELELSAVYA
ncbi:MAG: hypothetical protein HUU20_06340 [Pirellulales bacterium]|nr:hypothetical protein [Pirellulales bacterium]